MFQRSLTTRIHPLALIGLFVSKKMIALQLAKFYGLPKLYRRLAQANRSAFAYNSVRYVGVRDAVQRLFRLPAEIDKFVVSEGICSTLHCQTIGIF
jgi:hypothetical protein